MTFDSKTRHGPGELAESVGGAARATLGMLRRMAIKVTSSALWQVIGHRMLDGKRETRDAEVFYGIGFWSRPKSSEKAEAFVAFAASGSGNPLVVATRNEDARRAVSAALGAISEGDTLVYASSGPSGIACVHVKNGGTVEAKLAGGDAVELATKADLQRLRTALSTATIALGAAGAAAVVTSMDAALGSPPAGTTGAQWPKGTSVLKGQ